MAHAHTHLDCGSCPTVHNEYKMMHGLRKDSGSSCFASCTLRARQARHAPAARKAQLLPL